MENHPIPQDITGFQFKLIGDMTIKQFAYLAGGIVVAWITFITPLVSIIRLPLSALFILFGVGMAFLPIEGRPMDLMVSNFAKALFSSTQFIYQKTGGHLWVQVQPAKTKTPTLSQQQQNQASALSGEKLKEYLNSLPKRPKNQLDQKEMVFFESLANLYASPQQGAQLQMPNMPRPHLFENAAATQNQQPEMQTEQKTKEETQKPSEKEQALADESQILQQQLNQAKTLEAAQTNSTQYKQAHEKVLELENMLRDTAKQKQDLERQITELQKRLTTENKPVFAPSVAQAPQKETRNVRTIPQGLGKSVGLPIAPEFPNLVTGIVKDPRGNPLANVLVEVKDTEGNPVRAFKTNPLGQFASATPINNGTYTIEFEDPKGENKFDVIQFNATGQIILPIEVISVDTREELRRSLFN